MKNRIELIDSPANTQRNRLSRTSSSLHFIYIELPPIKPVKEHYIQAGLIYGILSENTKRRRPHKASKITSLTPPFLLHLVFYFSLYSINYYISLLQCVLALIPLANIISSLRQYFPWLSYNCFLILFVFSLTCIIYSSFSRTQTIAKIMNISAQSIYVIVPPGCQLSCNQLALAILLLVANFCESFYLHATSYQCRPPEN